MNFCLSVNKLGGWEVQGLISRNLSTVPHLPQTNGCNNVLNYNADDERKLSVAFNGARKVSEGTRIILNP